MGRWGSGGVGQQATERDGGCPKVKDVPEENTRKTKIQETKRRRRKKPE